MNQENTCHTTDLPLHSADNNFSPSRRVTALEMLKSVRVSDILSNRLKDGLRTCRKILRKPAFIAIATFFSLVAGCSSATHTLQGNSPIPPLLLLCGIIAALTGYLLSTRRQLAATELELDLLLNYSSLRILFKDDKNNILRLNKVAADFFGLPQAEATGANVAKLNPSQAQAHYQQDLGIIATGQPSLGEVKQVWVSEDNIKWNCVDKIPYKDPQTGEDRILMVATDLTELINTEQALRRSEERYTLAVEKSAVGTWERDFTTNKAYWSPRVREIVGVTDPDFVPEVSDFETRLHPDDRARVLEALQNHLTTREPHLAEFRLRHEDGHYVWLRSRGQAVWDEDGTPLRMAGSVEDITANLELERQLAQAQKMEAVGQLTGGLAHDFNNLLAIILGNLQLLERTLPDDEKMQKRASAAVNAAEKGAELTRRLLAFARCQQLETEACDVNRLIDGMADMLGRTLGASIDIRTALSADIGPALIDPSQFEAAILNLAVNSRDAMPAGGKLHITTKAVHIDDQSDIQSDVYSLAGDKRIQPGDYIVVSFSDSGTGIQPTDIEHIFEPFYTTKEVGKGSGLGLSMVYGFMKQSGGHVGVYSETGKGTTVSMYVPLESSVSGTETTRGDSREFEPQGYETILIVEDNEGVREVAAEFLEELGYSVIVAEDGPSALMILTRRRDIDLLFTDIVLPGGVMGTQLAERAQQLRPDLPIIFTTGFASPDVLHDSAIDATHLVLSKPYRKSELATMVRSALDGAEPQADAAAPEIVPLKKLA